MTDCKIIDWKTITGFVTEAFVRYGVPEADAAICADVLLEADRRGIESHGVNRFKPIYLDRIRAGVQKPVTQLEILKDTPTTAVIDGHDGMGQVVGVRGMEMAIRKAKEYGMGMVVARNSCHYGFAGYYTDMAARAGCVGMTGTNARPSVAPTWGVEGMFGTNPLTLGVPTDEAFDFNFDCATSITQNGKIEYLARIGEPVQPGTIIGDDGELVTGDADAALRRIREGRAALTTVGGVGEALGGYKGYGFAMFVELLCAALADGDYGKALNGKNPDGSRCAPKLGHFFIAIDTGHFLGEDVCRRKSSEILRSVRASKRMPGAERIYTAGEKEYEIALKRADGLPVNPAMQEELSGIRDELGLAAKYPFPWDR